MVLWYVVNGTMVLCVQYKMEWIRGIPVYRSAELANGTVTVAK